MYQTHKNDIIRHLGFKLNLDVHISYKDFCKNKEFENIFDTVGSEDIYHQLIQYSFGQLWDTIDIKQYDTLLNLFLHYDYIETFSNILTCKTILKKGIENISKHTLNTIKFYLTDNNYFYNIDEQEKEILLYGFSDIERFTYPDTYEEGEQMKLEVEDYKSNITITQRRESHKILEYLYFLTIVSDLEIFIIIDPTSKEYIITSQDKLHEIEVADFIAINITKRIWGTIPTDSQSIVEEIKSRYRKDEDISLQVYKDIQELIKLGQSVRIKLQVQGGDFKSLDFDIRDQDLSKSSTIKNFKKGEEGISRTNGFEEYGTKKTAVISKGRIPYKTSNKK